MDTEEITYTLNSRLLKLLDSDMIRFGSDELKALRGKIGVYSIWKNAEVIYVGKTIRQDLKIRITEILADFRTHSLNKKLLLEMLLAKYGDKLKEKDVELRKRFDTEELKAFIAKEIFTEQEFSGLKADLREEIKSKLMIKCLPLEEPQEVTSLEHFAIAILKPKYND